MKSHAMRRAFWVALIWIGSAGSAGALLVTEPFNNYGVAELSLSGRGTNTGGWAGAWVGSAGVRYMGGSHLTFFNPGYDPSLNVSSVSNGAAGRDDGAFAGGDISNRRLDTDYLTGGNQGMTGTIWILCLVNNHSNSTDVLFHLDSPDGPGNFVGLVGTTGTTFPGPFNDGVPEPAMQYAGFTDYTSTADRVAGATHMLLVKIQMNMAGGTNDGCELWVDPPLFAGEAGLGFPIYSYGYADAFGEEFSGVGISFNKVSFLNNAKPRLDDIRISNGPNGFAEILSGMSPAPTRFTAASVSDGVVSLEISDLTPGATNHITRAMTIFDEVWTTAHTFVASGLITNWSEPAVEGTSVFYRVQTDR